MNKKELVAAVAAEANVSQLAAGHVVNRIISNIATALKEGDKVVFVGFGTFGTVQRSARFGRNPRTGETLKIAAKVSVSFKPGKALQEAVNK